MLSSLFLWSFLTILVSCQLSFGKDDVCAFPEKQTIKDFVADVEKRVLYNSNGFKVYPQLVFPCGGTLSKITLLSYSGSTSTESRLEVQLFVPVADEDFTTPLQDDSMCRKYEPVPLALTEAILSHRTRFRLLSFDLLDAVEVPAGAILGLQHTGTTLVYQKLYNGIQSLPAATEKTMCIPDDYNDEESSGNFPIVAVDIGCTCKNCTTGFMTTNDLRQIIQQESEVLYSLNEISVIPHLNFSTQGTVSSWTLAVRRVVGLKDSALPQIQIWRPSDTTLRVSASGGDEEFRLVDSREIYVEEDEVVVSFELDSVMKVEPGDVLGVKQPGNSELLLLFGRGGHANFIADLDREVVSSSFKSVMRLPLITPEFDSSRNTFQSTPQPNPSQSPSGSTKGNVELPIPAIIGGVLGPLVIGLASTLSIVAACLAWRKMRKRESQEHHIPVQQPVQPGNVIGSNPVYEAPVNDSLAEPFYIAPTHNSALYESIHVAQMYEVPTTSLSVQSDVDSHHIYHVLEASSHPHGEDNDDSDVYETLQPLPSELSGEKSKEHEYQELEADNSSSAADYEIPQNNQKKFVGKS